MANESSKFLTFAETCELACFTTSILKKVQTISEYIDVLNTEDSRAANTLPSSRIFLPVVCITRFMSDIQSSGTLFLTIGL